MIVKRKIIEEPIAQTAYSSAPIYYNNNNNNKFEYIQSVLRLASESSNDSLIQQMAKNIDTVGERIGQLAQTITENQNALKVIRLKYVSPLGEVTLQTAVDSFLG